MADKKDFKSVSFRRWLYPSESSSVSAIGFYAKEVPDLEDASLPLTVQTELLIHHGNKAISLHNKPGAALDTFYEKLQNLLLFLRDFQEALRESRSFAARKFLDENVLEYSSAIYAEYDPKRKEGYIHIQSCHGATRIHIIPDSPETRVAVMGLIDFVRESIDHLCREFVDYFADPRMFQDDAAYKAEIRSQYRNAWEKTFGDDAPSDYQIREMTDSFCKEKAGGYDPAYKVIHLIVRPVYRRLKIHRKLQTQ